MVKRNKDEIFLICPQTFVGPNRQKFYVTEMDLIKIYKLNPENCILYGNHNHDNSKNYTIIKPTHDDVVRLFPDEFQDHIEKFPDKFSELLKSEDEKEEFHGFDDETN